MKSLNRFMFIIFFLTSVIIAVPQGFAHAQDPVCTDAAGSIIPCPPTAEIPCGQAGGPACPPAPDDDNSSGGKQKPTAVPPTSTPTATPLPISAAPTSTPLPDKNYLGSCSNNADGNIFDCFDQFKCEDGLLVIKVDLYSNDGTKYDFYCIPDENVPQLDLPITIPTDNGSEENWTGGCNADAFGGVDACLDTFSAICKEEGGEISIWNEDDGSAGFYCQNESEADTTAATESPANLVAPQDPPAPQPEPKPSTPWVPIGLGFVVVVLIILLLPAVQKARSAAARQQSGRMLNNKHPELVKNKPDDDSTEAMYIKIDDIKGESASTQPKPDDEESVSMQYRSKRSE